MNDKPITHPDWCQRDRCKTSEDGSITHGHLFGSVDDIDIVVERTDVPDESGKVKHGPFRAFSHINTAGRRTTAEFDRAHRLLQKAATFTGQRMDRGTY